MWSISGVKFAASSVQPVLGKSVKNDLKKMKMHFFGMRMLTGVLKWQQWPWIHHWIQSYHLIVSDSPYCWKGEEKRKKKERKKKEKREKKEWLKYMVVNLVSIVSSNFVCCWKIREKEKERERKEEKERKKERKREKKEERDGRKKVGRKNSTVKLFFSPMRETNRIQLHFHTQIEWGFTE